MDFGFKCYLILLLLYVCSQHNAEAIDVMISPTLFQDDGARCLNGIRAEYYFSPGSDECSDNWLVFLQGGGWCFSFEDCLKYINARDISKPAAPVQFTGILSNDYGQNPDFYNWNKVMVRYCDGSSFTGRHSKKTHNGTTLYFRGARIYKSLIKEMRKKGMKKSANNALLVGESAGGVATMLHCDEFRKQFSSSTRVKCLSDAGYFFAAKRHNYGHTSAFVSTFQGLVTLQKSAKSLPESCTSKMNPAMCFFAQNVQKDIRTPIFFIMSEFDVYEIGLTTGKFNDYNTCMKSKNCTTDQIKVVQDLRSELFKVLPQQDNCTSRGFLIDSGVAHQHTTLPHWYEPTVGTNETMAKYFGDWYYDRKVVQIIDKCDHPYGCM